MVDVLGNPPGFLLTPGQAHDLEGADAFMLQIEADAFLADKAYDADKRVIAPLRAAGIAPVIPSVPGRAIRRAGLGDCPVAGVEAQYHSMSAAIRMAALTVGASIMRWRSRCTVSTKERGSPRPSSMAPRSSTSLLSAAT